MNNRLTVRNLDGKQISIDVIDIIEDTQENKNYICYTIAGLEDVFISLLSYNNDSYTIDTVTEEEKKNIEQVLASNMGI